MHGTAVPCGPARRKRGQLLLVLGSAGVIFLVCKLGMNPTEGQKLVVGGIRSSGLTAESAIPPALAGIAFLAGLGVSSLLRLPSLCHSRPHPAGWRLRCVMVPVLAAAGAKGALWFRASALNSHDCYNNAFTAGLLPALGASLGVALALAAPRPRLDASMAALGSAMLLFLYQGRFDYYHDEILFFGIAAGFPPRSRLASNPDAKSCPEGLMGPSPRGPDAPLADRRRFRGCWTDRTAWPRLAAVLLVLSTAGATAVWHTRSAVRLAVQQEHGTATIRIYEQAIRADKLLVQEVGMATFGYLGWLFQDYYAGHDGKALPVLGGFVRYAQNWEAGRGTGIIATLPVPDQFAWLSLPVKLKGMAAGPGCPPTPQKGQPDGTGWRRTGGGQAHGSALPSSARALNLSEVWRGLALRPARKRGSLSSSLRLTSLERGTKRIPSTCLKAFSSSSAARPTRGVESTVPRRKLMLLELINEILRFGEPGLKFLFNGRQT